MKLVLLAAGKSSRIFKKIKKPKCLLKINNLSLNENLINKIRSVSKAKIYIVVGFKYKMIKKNLKKYKEIKFINNPHYQSKEMLYSLILALKKINDDIIFSYTDITYNKSILKTLIRKKNFIYLPVLSSWKKVWKKRKKSIIMDAEDLKVSKKNFLISIGKKIKNYSKVKYQYMGILMIPRRERKKIINFYQGITDSKIHITDFLDKLVKNGIRIKCVKYSNKWYEFDDWSDYKNYF